MKENHKQSDNKLRLSSVAPSLRKLRSGAFMSWVRRVFVGTRRAQYSSKPEAAPAAFLPAPATAPRTIGGNSTYLCLPAGVGTLMQMPFPKAAPHEPSLPTLLEGGSGAGGHRDDATALQPLSGLRKLHLLDSMPLLFPGLGAWPYDKT